MIYRASYLTNEFNMYIYNVTIKIDWLIHERWLAWMREVEIPRMLGFPYFESHELVRLLETEEIDGPTYAIQYRTDTIENYKSYVTVQMAVDSAASYALWGQRCVFFMTLMEVVN